MPGPEDGRPEDEGQAAAGFDPQWLRLRSAYDDAARSDRLTRLFSDSLPENPRLLDLAAGTGANLRYLAPRIGRAGQRWVLADHDPALLDAVAGEMARWPHQAPALECRRVDLVHDLGCLNPADFDGIVATALFDLVSDDWARRFISWLDQAPRPVLFTLSVDGRLHWTPEDPGDTAMRCWIEAHQATDKGFGPALGPNAPALLAELLDAHGYDVFTEESDWVIGAEDAVGAEDAAMHRALIEGYRTAALEIAPADSTDVIDGWARRRLDAAERSALTALIGHVDIFARPR